ncbi:hypothetical protein VB711_07725 [Cronbergia sp. UHCC 0137]|uniref:hypothetical protein n=1 Tax=Cronbergia sp. UHCC 0137 TaxID=3110239 RepID=UPI002B20F164|nr:hypothetical protein [Cronbergia sp. UHCC 0137]MEA5617725.1 hypothetical protein [Cronbergia sp. UHCC 0137]
MSPVNQNSFILPYLIPIAAASLLMVIISEKNAGKLLKAMGEASEELFRGDRLPILDFPQDHE